MKFTKYFYLIVFILMTSFMSVAQKQTYDVLTYTQPAGWQKAENEGGLQLSVTDKKTKGYAIAIITKAIASNASANENFTNDWERLVKSTVQVNAAPAMQEPANENGWDILSGSANYTDGPVKGVATLLNATNNGQYVSVVLMTNTQKYQNELLNFINALELNKAPEQKNNMAVKSGSTNSAITGLWTYYTLETNGYQQYTAGYMRREYLFKEDGTYIFRRKNWLTLDKNILYVYESGKYSVNGNQLTITPKQGVGQFWSKTSSTKEWGKLIKSTDYKPETVTYTFQIIDDATYGNGIVLKPGKPTERDGGKFNAANDPYEFRYSFRKLESSIDNPPGFKTNTENAGTAQQNSSQQNTNKGYLPLAGKIWEANSPERYGSAYGSLTGFNTGGFWIYQYKFFANGTYQFVYNGVSGIANTPVNVLQYETGTYSVNGNRLTITPQKGTNEEWSVGKIDNGMSDPHKREVLEKRIKLLKRTDRQLEKITYPFAIEYWEGNKANVLLLQHAQPTVREGSPGQNNRSGYFEMPAAKATTFLDYK